MLEKVYAKWLETKNKIEYFEELDDAIKKEIYAIEQEYSDDGINLVEIDKYHSNNDIVDYYEFLFDGIMKKTFNELKKNSHFLKILQMMNLWKWKVSKTP